jgi:glycine cleavage system aminomethyltransferase T
MSVEVVHTAFDAPHRGIGCEFMDWEGWLWPNHFGDAAGEHRAVREGASASGTSRPCAWDSAAPTALRAADRIFTNDMLGLARARSATRRSATPTARWSATAPSSGSTTSTRG